MPNKSEYNANIHGFVRVITFQYIILLVFIYCFILYLDVFLFGFASRSTVIHIEFSFDSHSSQFTKA